MIDSKYGWRNVKVAMLVRDFSIHGGLELYTYQLVQELLNRGLQITVICEKLTSPISHENFKAIQIKPARAKANKVEQINHWTKEFTEAIKNNGPFDIVHSQHTPAHNVDVVTFHNHTISRLDKVGTPSEIAMNLLKQTFRADYIMRDEVDAMLAKEAKILLFPSRICKQDFIEHFKFQDRHKMASLSVAYPGWQIADSTPITQATSGNGKIPQLEGLSRENTIVFVGRGYRKKGLDVLLSACALLKQRRKNFNLLIAGLNHKLLNTWQLKLLDLVKEVHYLGFVPNMDSVYWAGSIMALPSRVEPFGMSVLQAMSYGLVPVVSKISGVAELLANETDSLLLDNHLDSKELADKLSFLLTNPDQLNAMSQAAVVKCQLASWQITADSTLTAYQQIFQSKYVV